MRKTELRRLLPLVLGGIIENQNSDFVKARNNAPNHNRYFTKKREIEAVSMGVGTLRGYNLYQPPWLQPTNQESLLTLMAIGSVRVVEYSSTIQPYVYEKG